MDRVLKKALQIGLALFDCIAINLLLPVLIYILQENTAKLDFSQIILISIITNVLWFSLFNTVRLYSFQQLLDFTFYFLKLTIAMILIWAVQVVIFLTYSYSKEIILEYTYAYLVLLLTVFLVRVLYVIFFQFLVKQQGFLSKAIIIGYNNTAKKLAEYLQRSTGMLQIVGYVDDADKVGELSVLPVYSGVINSIAIAKHLGINEIYSTLNPEEYPDVMPLLKESEKACIRFHFVSNVSDFIERGMVVNHFHHLSICSLRKDPLTDVGNKVIKRVFDVFLSLLVLVLVLSWLFPLLGLLIKLSSPGPILFKQLRSGLSDKPFYCFKFRTMRINDQADLRQATKNDSRITLIGSFLRKTSLDEFPQFLNVLKGEMSVVGPRPHMIKHTADFSKIAGQYMVRHLLKPGITGWAQVNGYRGEIFGTEQIRKRIEYDIWYLENWSLLLDIKIVFLTFLGLFQRNKNAY